MSSFVLFDDSLAGRLRLFAEPSALHLAWTAEELPGCFAALEAELARGRHLAGYAAYELGFALEARLGALMPAERPAPLLCFGAFEAPAPEARARALLAEIESATPEAAPDAVPRARPLWSLADYRERFERVLDYIRAGDTYQVNLTFPLALELEAGALATYGAIRRRQGVAHGALVSLAGPTLLSFSPELFFALAPDGRIEARPMKGTIARGESEAEDSALALRLAADEKNRAENLMIVDLLRNDLSRLCALGSVRVPSLFEVQRYATLHQMISRVEGRLAEPARLETLFGALFPCGSITGAPKIRAMEIIRELEPWPRGAYCGAIGWISPGRDAEPGCGPSMRFSVAIRTLSLAEEGRALLQVGGGLVHDSEAEAEYGECLLKARFATRIA